MCGIAAVIGVDKARYAINAGLLALQHRAHDFAGMAVTRADGSCATFSGAGHVWEVFRPKRLGKLRGKTAIGHIRYPTADDSTSAQPIVREWGAGWIAVAHNGNFTNTAKINATSFKNRGFETGMDTETLMRLILAEQPSMPEDIETLVAIIDRAQGQLEGSGSLLIMTPLGLVAMRDHSGNRPLVYGKHPEGGYVVASEACALTANGVYESAEVSPGTIMYFTETGVQKQSLQHGKKPERRCIFEAAYYCQAIGKTMGVPIAAFRYALGEKLAEEHPVLNAGLILPVQNSGLIAGRGFAATNPSGTLDEVSLIRNPYAGRTFIAGTQVTRDASVRRKFLIDPSAIRGKLVVLVDDSLVRGTTILHLVQLLKELGALEVHVRLAFPVWAHPCRYGIATKKPDELAINVHGSVEAICKYIEATSLGYISTEGLAEVTRAFADPEKFCMACVNGDFW